MVQINFAQKQVSAKIVYYGPGMSGKTTNLEVVHQKAPEQNKGELTSISTDGDRTLFFDFMPLDLGTVAGMRTSFQIYTVPGQVYYNSTRKLVLQGVDGVVFVADSSAAMVQENLESLRNLEENLNEYGKSLATLPHVIQFNKRDLPDALPVEELQRLYNRFSAPSFEAIASSGHGVFPTLKALAARVLEAIHATASTPNTAPRPAAPTAQGLGATGFHAPTPPMSVSAIPAPMPQRTAPVAAPMPTVAASLAQTGVHQAAQARPLHATGFHTPPTMSTGASTPSAPLAGASMPHGHAPMGGTYPGALPMQGAPAAPTMGSASTLGMAPSTGYAQPMSNPAMTQTGFHTPNAGSGLGMAMRPSTLHPNMAVPAQRASTPTPVPMPATLPTPATQAAARASAPLDGTRFRPRTALPPTAATTPAPRVQVRPAPTDEGSNKLYVGLFIAAGVVLTAGLTYVVMSFL
jgi:signal recognition particle receptor subunit beta